VKKLRLVWSWGMNDKRTESQPLVHDGVMFLNQSSSILQALDATNGDLFWSYERKLPPKLPPLAYGNCNIALLGTTIYTGTSDAFLVALDAKDGDAEMGTGGGGSQDRPPFLVRTDHRGRPGGHRHVGVLSLHAERALGQCA
jgi:glucose dehydrogenase